MPLEPRGRPGFISVRLPWCVPFPAGGPLGGAHSAPERLSLLLRVLMLERVDVVAFLGFTDPGPQLFVSHAYRHAGYRKRLC